MQRKREMSSTSIDHVQQLRACAEHISPTLSKRIDAKLLADSSMSDVTSLIMSSDDSRRRESDSVDRIVTFDEGLIATVYLFVAAAFLNMRSYASRLATFRGVHRSFPSSEEDFAEAGFFLVEEGVESDHVRCYMCNLGLQDWNHGDNPWTEHARFSPLCFHVKSCKGVRFLQRIAATAGSSPPRIPPTYMKSDHGGLLHRLLEIFHSFPIQAVICAGMAPKTVMLKVFRAWIHERKTYSSETLMEELHRDDDKAMKGEELDYQSSFGKEILSLCDYFYRQHHHQAAAGAATSSSHSENATVKVSATPPVAKPLETSKAVLKSSSDESQAPKNCRLCWSCRSDDLQYTCLPCAHFSLCQKCIKKEKNCPTCGARILQSVRTYMT